MALIIAFFSGCSSSEQAGTSHDSSTENYGQTAKYIASYIDDNTDEILPGAIGGEWIFVGKNKCGYGVEDSEKETYMNALVTILKEKKGVLDERKYSEYSRTIIGLSAIDEDASDVGGFNLFEHLEKIDQVIYQGINGPIWAIIAADSQNYDLGAKQKYIDYLLDNQLDDGGFALSGDKSDTDITAMAITALSQHKDQCEDAIDKAVETLASLQSENGEFVSFDTETSESCSQVIIALCSIGIDPSKDERFVKNGKSPVDILNGYKNDDGGFSHLKGEESNAMATEQAFLAFTALKCMENGEGLYI